MSANKARIQVRTNRDPEKFEYVGVVDATAGAGLPVESQNYAIQVDDTTTANVTYVGEAAPASLTSAAVWRIKKIDESSGTVVTWADGDTKFNNIWDNVASLSYS